MKKRQRWLTTLLGVTALVTALLAACGSEQSSEAAADTPDRPVVAVTTNILGDVVDRLVGSHFEVVTIMPVGSDPHDFQPSAQDIAALEKAGAIIVNGGGFEEGLLDPVEAAEAEGVPVFEAMSVVDLIDSSGDKDHDDDHGDEHDHEHDGVDPHFFTDPARMAVAGDGIVDFLIANVEGADAPAVRADADRYIDELAALDEEVEAMLAAVPESRRVLVTNHQVFSYFADRYDFEVVGTVVPTGSDASGVSGQRLAELAQVLRDEGVSVVFTDSSSSEELARTLANEVGDVAVIQLFSESLGEEDSGGGTYVDMVRSNALRISESLAN